MVRSRLIHRGANQTGHAPTDDAAVQIGEAETAGDFTLVEVALSPGGTVSDHAHIAEDETIYVLEGALDVRVGERRRSLGVGEYVLAPCGTLHGFANAGLGPARLLLIASPTTGRASAIA